MSPSPSFILLRLPRLFAANLGPRPLPTSVPSVAELCVLCGQLRHRSLPAA